MIEKRAVVCFGRLNPPTVGHARLVQCLRQAAVTRNAIPMVFPSVSEDKDKNPIPFHEKVTYIRQMFPDVVVSDNAKVRTPLDVLALLSFMGFESVYFVVGSDRAQEFQRIGRYVKSHGLPDGQKIILKEFGVIVVPELRNPRMGGVEAMSGTKLRALALAGDYAAFAQGIPSVNTKVIKSIYARIRSKHV